MAMEMFSSTGSLQDIFSLDLLVRAVHALRYELTFAVVMLAFWFMGQLTGFRPKPLRSAKKT